MWFGNCFAWIFMVCLNILQKLRNLIFIISKTSTFSIFGCCKTLYNLFLVFIEFKIPLVKHLCCLCLYLLNLNYYDMLKALQIMPEFNWIY